MSVLETARTHTQMRTDIRDKIQDGSTAVWANAELDQYIKASLKELSRYVPNRVKESTTFASDTKEVDISFVSDLIGIEQLEYKAGQEPRHFKNFEIVDFDKIRLVVEGTPITGETINLFCAKNHHLDPDWIASATVTLGDTAAPTTKTGRRYTCIQAGTAGATEPTWSTVAGATVTDSGVKWKTYLELSNSLEHGFIHLEDELIDLVVARALLNKGTNQVNTVSVSRNALQEYLATGERELRDVLKRLRAKSKPKQKQWYPTSA